MYRVKSIKDGKGEGLGCWYLFFHFLPKINHLMMDPNMFTDPDPNLFTNPDPNMFTEPDQICSQNRIQIFLRNRFWLTCPIALSCSSTSMQGSESNASWTGSKNGKSIFNCGFSTIYISNSRIIKMWIKHF